MNKHILCETLLIWSIENYRMLSLELEPMATKFARVLLRHIVFIAEMDLGQ